MVSVYDYFSAVSPLVYNLLDAIAPFKGRKRPERIYWLNIIDGNLHVVLAKLLDIRFNLYKIIRLVINLLVFLKY